MSISTDNLYLHLLNRSTQLGPARLNKLAGYFPSFEKAFRAGARELQEAGVEKKIAEDFIDLKRNLDPDQEIKKLDQENIQILGFNDPGYPESLKEIYDPPVILYYKGKIPASQKIGLAIVGSRKNSDYGVRAIESLLPPLVSNYQEEISIISGLALGIDAQAHQTAVSQKINTIAVLGCGLDEKTVFPPQNQSLARQILEADGVLVSEFPPETPALKHHFPLRNRIISGLSRAVIVVEAEKKSGSLITANLALEQGREVMAIPGNIFSSSSGGTNKLIQKGAQPILETQDIATTLDLTPKEKSSTNNNRKIEFKDEQEERIFSCLGHSPLHVEYLVKLSGLDITTLNTKLTQMEIKGTAKNVGGMKFIKLG